METKNELDFAPVYRGEEPGASFQPLRRIDQALQGQRGYLLPWVPVCLGFGIGAFFLLKHDPGAVSFGLVVLAIGLAILQIRHRDARGVLAWAILLVGLGFCTAALRSASVAAPVLSFRYYGPIEGRVIALDRSGSGAIRMTLDQLRLSRLSAGKTPARLRLSLSASQNPPAIGTKVAVTAHVMPPQGPNEPGGFDYRRHAWFLQVGANGYSRNPIVILQPAGDGLAVQRFRQMLSAAVQARLPVETGGFAAAIIAGDRSGVAPELLLDLRTSNLAHLLAISGLHMGLLTGFVFVALRFGLCLSPPLALRCNVKKLAAIGALAAAAVYLGISGGNVSTERAFIMVFVLLAAVLLDRRALSLRAVAVAATLVLLRRPETLLSPGFQMSFAATTALVAVFGWIRDTKPNMGPAWLRAILTVVISSSVAGLATAPFGAASFNTVAHYGLLANVLAVPIMGLVVVPCAVLALCLLPLELESIGLIPLELGLRWILAVASWVSDLPNARSGVVSPDLWVLPLLALGALVVVLWKGQGRWLGGVLVGVAMLLWMDTKRPVVLIAADGGLVGVLGPDGRALSRNKAASFVAQAWLRLDADLSPQVTAAQRWPKAGNGDRLGLPVAGFTIVHITGKRQAADTTDCSTGELLVSNTPLPHLRPCQVLQPSDLRSSGSIAIHADGKYVTAAELAGDRPWSRN
ncbi:ComEC/Rec2 family competence protein [Pseudophaeobacter sp.]|uniref:ComEC/Rec2 family competence protein n=1 Tax=Pseudophaeobacter sp. TaxID=1971739 RepID=UPI003298A145